jgi:hypothetical protein
LCRCPTALPEYSQHAHDVGDVALHTAPAPFLHEIAAHCEAFPVKAVHASVACVTLYVLGAAQS